MSEKRIFVPPFPISPQTKEAVSQLKEQLGINNESALWREAMVCLARAYGKEIKDVHPLHGGVRPGGSFFSPSVLSEPLTGQSNGTAE